jgi:hypothetical protein
MLEDLIKCESVLRIRLEDLENQVSAQRVDLCVLWEGVLNQLDPLIGALDVGGLEGRSADEECVQDDSNAPNVYLIGMAGPGAQHLRSDVIRCPTDRSLPLSIEHDFRR